MNGVERADGGVSNTLQIQEAALYTQEHSETQLHTLRVVALQNKTVGFHSVSGGCGVSGEKFVFSLVFTVLMESVQPNLQYYK